MGKVDGHRRVMAAVKVDGHRRVMAVKAPCMKKRMDEDLKIECSKILKELIDQSEGWAFSEPPEVKIPRDLRRVKRKLEGDIYFGAKEFEDDVRRSFDNAKPYSPRWAAVLDANFMRSWKFLLAKLNKKHQHIIKPDVVNQEKSSSSCATMVEADPNKALRAAMLKTRFADTISRATQTLLAHKSDHPSKNQQEISPTMLNMRREKQRKALQEMEKAAGVDDTATMLNMLFGSGYPTSEALHRLGLHIKDQEEEEDD